MKVSLQDLLENPEWRLCALDPERSEAVFTQVSRQEIDEWNFADQAFLKQDAGRKYVSVAMADLQAGMGQAAERPPVHYLFHTSLCGSTLLSRGLNSPGTTLSVREPNSLLQLAQFKRENASMIPTWEPWVPLIDTVVSLLAKPFQQGEKVIIKPSNSMNNLQCDLLSLESAGASLMLYSGLREFLVSNLKKQEHFARYCSNLWAMLRADFSNEPDLPVPATDVQRAALCWALQLRAATQLPPSLHKNMRLLNSRIWFTQAEPVLSACRTLFELSASPGNTQPVLSEHSKYGGEYSALKKDAEDAEVLTRYGDDIEAAETWLSVVLPESQETWHQLEAKSAATAAEFNL